MVWVLVEELTGFQQSICGPLEDLICDMRALTQLDFGPDAKIDLPEPHLIGDSPTHPALLLGPVVTMQNDVVILAVDHHGSLRHIFSHTPGSNWFSTSGESFGILLFGQIGFLTLYNLLLERLEVMSNAATSRDLIRIQRLQYTLIHHFAPILANLESCSN